MCHAHVCACVSARVGELWGRERRPMWAHAARRMHWCMGSLFSVQPPGVARRLRLERKKASTCRMHFPFLLHANMTSYAQTPTADTDILVCMLNKTSPAAGAALTTEANHSCSSALGRPLKRHTLFRGSAVSAHSTWKQGCRSEEG